MVVSPHNPNVVFTTGSLYFNSSYWAGVSFTTDGGTTWHRDTLDTLTRGRCIAFDPLDSMRVYLGADSGYSYRRLYVSTDRGATWQTSDAGLAGFVNSIAARPDDPSVVLAGTSSGVYRSTNSGANWTQQRTGDTRAVVWDPFSPGAAYAGAANGVYISTDGGGVWAAYNTGLGNTNILCLAIRPGARLYAGTSGGSVYATDPFVGIAAPPAAPADSRLRLGPNPARDRITIHSSLLPATGHLYDAAGRRVRSFAVLSSPLALDVSALPAGAYVVCLRAAGTTLRSPLLVTR